jgi:hypothetical protein
MSPRRKNVMRKGAAACGLVLALVLVPAAGAGATESVGLPVHSPASTTVPPPGFTSNSQQAIQAAATTSTMRALHAQMHPMFVQPLIWNGNHWFITFSYRGKLVAEVDVSPSAHVTAVWTGPLAIASYARGNYSPLFDSWWIVVPFSLLFLVPFVNPRRWRRMLHLDALVLLSFLLSYYLFDHRHLEAAVWLVYPPLLYLLIRMIAIGVRRRRTAIELPQLLTPRVLGAGLLLLVAARVGLSLANHLVTDVGYASVIGAHRLVNGQSLYYASSAHGDTYGPIAYLAYVPFEMIFPWHGAWDYLASAHVASVAFDLATIVGLVTLGRRLKPGREGRRLGLALGWAWAACPFTLLGLLMHTNDGLIAMLSVLSLLVFSSPAARGAVLGLAAAAKFSPAALLPLYASDRERGLKATVICGVSFLLVVVASIGLTLPSGGLSEFYNHTLGYQLGRPDVFSPWALHPGLNPLKLVIEAGALLMAAAVAFVPRQRTFAQICALAAAVTIAVQLPAVHWFYYYVIWFMPFVLVALFGREPSPPAPGGDELPSPERRSAPAGERSVLLPA